MTFTNEMKSKQTWGKQKFLSKKSSETTLVKAAVNFEWTLFSIIFLIVLISISQKLLAREEI